MDTHGIDVTVSFRFFALPTFSPYASTGNSQHALSVQVVSLANPWLDFLEPEEAIEAARDLNVDVQNYCETYCAENDTPAEGFEPQTTNRLFAFGSLPLVPGIETSKVLEAIKQVQELSYLRGVVMGTKGIGKGLDDPAMEPIYQALAEAGMVVFVHPHYGIENAFGDIDNGHVLPLSLGFPMETTIVSDFTLIHAPVTDLVCLHYRQSHDSFSLEF